MQMDEERKNKHENNEDEEVKSETSTRKQEV